MHIGTSISNSSTTCFGIVLNVHVSIVVLAFIEAERNMYYRHKAALMYDTSAISFAFTAAELPFLIGTCFTYTTIFYFMLGFAVDAGKFFFYYLFMWLCMSCFTYFGHMVRLFYLFSVRECSFFCFSVRTLFTNETVLLPFRY